MSICISAFSTVTRVPFSAMQTIIGPRRKKTGLHGFVNNKGADQSVHLCSLISAFVIRLL